MEEKIKISRSTGEIDEKKVICHFKTTDDSCPHIKGVSILIVDREENNNGNKVLEFYWEKDGVYQAIADTEAWAEVKSVVVDIIKNNVEVAGED